ncbi:hypothetical protein AKO1_013835 [Acrasis kona]|uniref:FH2 domain-containing protein n=1 Tax=Acrasis kona TaxID=1008807 RepID=A0AAW2ZGY0_9EUKA
MRVSFVLVLLVALSSIFIVDCSRSLSRARSKAHNGAIPDPPVIPLPPPLKPDGASKPKRVKTNKVHWTSISVDKISNSIYKNKMKDNIKFDADAIIDIFAQPKTTPPETKPIKQRKTELLDPKRGQNIAIAMNRFKPYRGQLTEQILRMSLISDLVPTLSEIAPSKEELQLIQSYKGPVESLAEAEKFLWEIRDISDDLKLRAKAWMFMLGFDELVSPLELTVKTITKVTQEVASADKFHELLRIILNIGNALNVREVKGIKVHSLLPWSEVKSSDKKTTLMRYLVQLLVKNNQALLTFGEQLKTVYPATNVMRSSDLMKQTAELNTNFNQVSAYDIKTRSDIDIFQTEFNKFRIRCAAKLDELKDLNNKMIDALKKLATLFGEEEDAFIEKGGYDEFFKDIHTFLLRFDEAKNVELKPVTKDSKQKVIRK